MQVLHARLLPYHHPRKHTGHWIIVKATANGLTYMVKTKARHRMNYTIEFEDPHDKVDWK